MVLTIALALITLSTITSASISVYLLVQKLKTVDNKKNENPSTTTNPIHLTFEDCNKIIDDITNDIWQNKYFINYRLKEVVIISNMDKEIASFTEEVIHSIGDPVMVEALKYYSYDYIIQRIVRKSQMLFIEYTNTYKPSTK